MDFKKEAARVAFTLVKKNSSLGLGDGSTIRWFAGYLIEAMNQGLTVNLYTSSRQTEKILQDAGRTVLDISSADRLDQYFDGCDQVDRQLNAVKSGGGIHTQEKLFASMSDQFIILAEESKFVSVPGSAFPLVLEVLPQAKSFVLKELKKIFPGAAFTIRISPDHKGTDVITRNGNLLIECRFPEWPDPEFIQMRTKQITGVVEISLFYHMADEAFIAGVNGVFRYQKKNELVNLVGRYPLESTDAGM